MQYNKKKITFGFQLKEKNCGKIFFFTEYKITLIWKLISGSKNFKFYIS